MEIPFDADELAYLLDDTRRLARIATADTRGLPHVTPVGMWKYDEQTGTIEVSGRQFAATKKFRNVEKNPHAALVIDDIASSDPWKPRALHVQGSAVAIVHDAKAHEGVIRITPEHVTSWGLDRSDSSS